MIADFSVPQSDISNFGNTCQNKQKDSEQMDVLQQ